MNRFGCLVALLLAAGVGTANAQQLAAKMVADGHYLGAREEAEHFLKTAEQTDKGVSEAEALSLVCDYVLKTPGTADRMGEWLKENRASQYAEAIAALQRNQLIKDGRYEDAIELLFEAEERGDALPESITLAYPLTALSDEAVAYNAVLYRLAGEQLYDLGNHAQAKPYLLKGERTRNSMYKLGMCHYEDKEYEPAALCFSESADTANDEQAQNAWMHAGVCYLKIGNKKSAQVAFQQASQMKANSAIREEALYNYALTLREGETMGFGESVTVMERFLNEYSGSKHAQAMSEYLTEVFFTTKNYSAALNSINKIQKPNNEILTAKQRVLYNLGIQEFNAGQYRNTLNYVNQAIALGKKDAEAHAESYYLKGESEFRLGDYKGAANDLKQAIAYGATTKNGALKNKAYAVYSLGYAYFKQKDYRAALPQFEKFVKASDGASPRMVGDAYNRMGDCYLDSRQYDKAYAAYQSAIDKDKSHGDYSILQQAYIQGLRGDYDAKVALIDQMNAEYASSEYTSDALFEQGRAYVQKGNAELAQNTFNSIIERFPQSANARKAHNEIAMLLAEEGKTEAAIQAYRKVIADYPSTEEASTALANLKDVYTSQGRLDEYMKLAKQVGKTFTAEEMDEMVREAAIKALTSGNYAKALEHYTALRMQTPSDDYRLEAQTGMLRSAYGNKNWATTIEVANEILDDANKLSPEIKAEARMYRAESMLKTGNSKDAVADLQVLAQDVQTVYGAQATVTLSQYAYDTKQYASAETILSNFIDSGTSHTYWLARAFVLLSDVYKAQGRDIEARETLLSLKSNYTESEEINKMIEERLKN